MKTKEVQLTNGERKVVELILDSNPSLEEMAIALNVKIGSIGMYLNRIYRECDINVERRFKRAELIHRFNNGEITITNRPQL